MGKDNLTLWIIEIIIAWAILFAVQIPIRKMGKNVVSLIVFVVKIILIPITAMMFFTFTTGFGYRHGDIIVAVYIALIADVAASIIEFVIRLIKQRKNREERMSCQILLLGIISAVCLTAYFMYGYKNGTTVHMKQHFWKIDGITKSHTFAFVSDIHADSDIALKQLEDLCRQINEADPEFVILGGDTTDDLSTHDEMTEAYRLLSEINAPVYFIYGNHDRQPDADLVGGRGYTDSELVEAIQNAGIVILKDEYVKVNDDIVLLGREDMSMEEQRADYSSLVNPYEGEGTLIVVDHQPHDKEQLAEENAALQLSGHVHAGQIWPLRFLCLFKGMASYGEYEEQNTLMYVSAGECNWMLPFRTEARCEWDLITVKAALAP